MMFRLLFRLLLLSVSWLVLLIGVAWAFGALWFDFPVSALRRPLAAVFALSAIAALAFVWPRWGAQFGVAGLDVDRRTIDCLSNPVRQASAHNRRA